MTRHVFVDINELDFCSYFAHGGIVNPNLYDFTLFLPQKKHLLPFIELKHAKLLFKLLKLSINFSI
ncbi:hypothetical protein B4U81_16525 [Vibrio campbellii]|nr:hypothetical protein B4U81_16525 [Vibrio campbellii]